MQTARSIRAGARQHYPDGVTSALLGKRLEENVYGFMGRAIGRAGRKVQAAIAQAYAGVGRDDVEMVGFDRYTVLRLQDWQCNPLGQNLGKQTGVVGVQVLNQYQRHTNVGAQTRQQPRDSFQPASGCADADHGVGHRACSFCFVLEGRISLRG